MFLSMHILSYQCINLLNYNQFNSILPKLSITFYFVPSIEKPVCIGN